MAIDKALNQAPLGLTDEDLIYDPEMDIEVEIEPDEYDEAEEDNEEFDEDAEEAEEAFNQNLAEVLDDKVLVKLAGDLISEFDEDVSSRKDWMQTYVDGLELLGMKLEERTEPWPGACGVYHPLLSEALVKFQAETMMETFPAAGPIKTRIIGKETTENKDAAARVQEDMNYQLTDVMSEYRPEHERMLWGLGLAGNAFKKVYYDPSLGRQVSMYVPAEDVVVPYGASNLQTCERVTHVMRKTENEVAKLQASGFYADAELGEPNDALDEIEKKIAEQMGFRATSDDRYKLLEMHVSIVIEEDPEADEDGLALPYVVTLEKSSSTILAIRRNWHPEDKLKAKRNHFVHYAYVPGFGFYAFGLIHLIGAFAKSGTSILRQLVDAGTLSNLPGGFKTKGLRVKGDDTPIGPAEWRDVDVASGTMRDNILPLPYKEPSQVLAALLDKIVEEGRRFASAADLKLSDMSAQAPVGTTLAILERTLKVMSAVQARIHYAMKQEFILLRDIIRDYTPDEYSYEPVEGSRRAKKSDYDLVTVLPVSDPNAATMAQKVVQYQAAMQFSQNAPQLYDLPYLHRQMLNVLGIKDSDKIVPLTEDQKPRDPVSENMGVMGGSPLKAFLYQDHEAHMAVHMAFMNDPQTAATLGQNPQAQSMIGSLQAHIAEHYGMMYRKQVEDAAGVPYPQPDAPMDEATEMEISRLAAAAAQKVLQAKQAAAQQQQNEQTAKDPIVQMQMQELGIKEKELALKEKRLMVDAAAKDDQLDIERERIAVQERIAGLQVGAKIGQSKDALSAKQEADGLRMGIEIARDAMNRDRQQASTDEAQTEDTYE